jgi:hypothetical protein
MSAGANRRAYVSPFIVHAVAEAKADAPPVKNILCLCHPGADKAVDQDDEALTSGNLLISATFKNLKCLMLAESSFSRRWPLEISMPNKF